METEIKLNETMDYLKSILYREFKGKSHYKISVEIDGEIYSTTTTNSQAISAAFNDDYDFSNQACLSHYCFEDRDHAREYLVNLILEENNIHLKDDNYIKELKHDKVKELMQNLNFQCISPKKDYYIISVKIEGKKYRSVTKNTDAIFAAFKDLIDIEDFQKEKELNLYSSIEEAREALLKKILNDNIIKLVR